LNRLIQIVALGKKWKLLEVYMDINLTSRTYEKSG
jgi:hypothetical protein